MHLRLITPDTQQGSGYMAQLFLDGVDVSMYTRRIVIEYDVEKPITATVELFLSSMEVDLPAVVKALDVSPLPVSSE